MNVEALVGTVSAAAASAVVTGEAVRRYWARREARQQTAFRRAVQQIVDESMADVISRQADFERRQGQHLDRQDKTLQELRQLVSRRRGPRGD